MKIIGETKDGYIIEASRDDVANLIGYYYGSAMKNRLSTGDEIQINKMFRQLYNLEHNQPELRKVVDSLRGIADLLEPCCPMIEAQIRDATKGGEASIEDI